MKLFRLENYEAVLNSEEIMLIPEFKRLFELKYNKGKGDSDGRKRIRANKELVYLFLVKDYKSEFANFSNAERHRESLIAANLPEDYEISEELKDAMQAYDKLQQTLSFKALSSVRNTLLTSMEMTNTLEIMMQDKLLEIQKDYGDDDKLFDVDDMANLMSLIERAGKIAAGLPKIISTLESLEDKVKAEKQDTSNKIRGDQEEGWLS